MSFLFFVFFVFSSLFCFNILRFLCFLSLLVTASFSSTVFSYPPFRLSDRSFLPHSSVTQGLPSILTASISPHSQTCIPSPPSHACSPCPPSSFKLSRSANLRFKRSSIMPNAPSSPPSLQQSYSQSASLSTLQPPRQMSPRLPSSRSCRCPSPPSLTLDGRGASPSSSPVTSVGAWHRAS